MFPGDFLIPRENESETLLTITGTLRSHVTRAVTIRRERTAVYRGTATLYRGTYRDILQIMYL